MLVSLNPLESCGKPKSTALAEGAVTAYRTDHQLGEFLGYDKPRRHEVWKIDGRIPIEYWPPGGSDVG